MRIKSNNPDLEQILLELEYFAAYNTKDGGFVYTRKRRSSSPEVGSRVGHYSSNGYLHISILGQKYLIHRLVWLWHNGEIPIHIDHIDRNRLNNRIENLRSVTNSINLRNQHKRSNNKSGHRGISWSKSNAKWLVHVLGKHIGFYLTVEEAVLARDKYIAINSQLGVII